MSPNPIGGPRIFPSDEQVAYAREAFKKANFDNQWSYKTPEKEMVQYFGFLGEIVMEDLLDLPRSQFNGPDEGHDIVIGGRTIDIKTRTGSVAYKRYFCHNIKGRMHKKHVDAYLFLYYHREEGYFLICGWLPKTEFYRLATWTPEGGTRERSDGTQMVVRGNEGMWEISHEHLLHTETLLEEDDS